MNKYKYDVTESKKIRVIIDTDAANEADDQYAIVHTLLTPKFIVKGIIAEHFGRYAGENTAKRSFSEIERVLKKMGISDMKILLGAKNPMQSEDDLPVSEGADFLISEALRADERPLFVLCLGAITNVGIALKKCPEIADKFTCIWIGGAAYPNGGWEFNLCQDYHAANILFERCKNLWQIPSCTYSLMKVSYAELQAKVMPCGAIGRYLFEELIAFGRTVDWTHGESWILGDSPAPGIALDPACGQYEESNAPITNDNGDYIGERENRVRVYHRIDPRFILEDFFAKLTINFGE